MFNVQICRFLMFHDGLVLSAHLTLIIYKLNIIATAKWFCNCSVSLRPADCVVKPRRCAASPAFYALSTELMKTDHFTKPLRGGYKYKNLFYSENQNVKNLGEA
jgi:hypothetical protein